LEACFKTNRVLEQAQGPKVKRFSFDLEKFLELRKFREQEARIELGRAIGILSDIEKRILSLAEERARAAAGQFSPGNSAATIQQYMFYLLRLDAAREQLLKEAALAEQKVEEAREAYIEASRDRKALDKLKEKREKEYHKAALAEDAKVLDDVYRGSQQFRIQNNHGLTDGHGRINE
jgi:flagellar FliJ protein